MNALEQKELLTAHPILQKLKDTQPVVWFNEHKKEMKSFTSNLSEKDVLEAEKLMKRFQPFLRTSFPELVDTNGILESPLRHVDALRREREKASQSKISGRFYLKCDHELPVAGSIKARGGFYEVLHYAETLAIESGMIQKNDDYTLFAQESFKRFFSQYAIGVASTGNLGLSIGIMSAKLGFKVSVYMSRDAKQWKKELLRYYGAHVYEFDGDFSHAIAIGRDKTNAQSAGYFVDDEDSENLFLGYSTAALEIKRQLQVDDIKVDEDHPLFLYLPCGVGGSPGGITFGMKQLFGDHVHCFFAEPTHAPSVLLGMETRLMSDISVQDIGLDNLTEADGLAVGRPSSFATALNDQLISGIYTIEDDTLYALLAQLKDSEGLYVEPSAAAGLVGPEKILSTSYIQQNGIIPENITHIAWSTGGSLVPEKDRNVFYERGKELLNNGYFNR
ncbi:MAG TPA: D-serine ammonia-lyase [Virgibacillus sp.]|nr:D-serine ammonia-lyase [Virgibacillus sp.]